jgi:hypothetical protein
MTGASMAGGTVQGGTAQGGTAQVGTVEIGTVEIEILHGGGELVPAVGQPALGERGRGRTGQQVHRQRGLGRLTRRQLRGPTVVAGSARGPGPVTVGR